MATLRANGQLVWGMAASPRLFLSHRVHRVPSTKAAAMAKPKVASGPRKERPLLEPSLAGAHGDSKFARALGSVDFHTREAGLRAMAAWLSRRGVVEESDLLKLWKGVFYCFWHSDSAPVQVRGPGAMHADRGSARGGRGAR